MENSVIPRGVRNIGLPNLISSAIGGALLCRAQSDLQVLNERHSIYMIRVQHEARPIELSR